MKKNIFYRPKTSKVSVIVAILWIGFLNNRIEAQIQINGSLYVGANNVVFIENGNVNFGENSTTTTAKTPTKDGKGGRIILGRAANFSTDGNASKFVDGFAEAFNTSETILSIGEGKNYAPVRIISSSESGVRAAYFNKAPLIEYPGGLDASVSAISDTEYWIIKGANAKISLSWRISDVIGTYSYPDITIVGYNASTSKWEKIPSAIDTNSVFAGTSTLTGLGSITSISDVTLSNYAAFGIGQNCAVDRYKVSLSTSTGIANQVVITYLPHTTLDYDYSYDAELFSTNPIKMYSILEKTFKKLVINARPTFKNSDEVSLGFSKETSENIQMSFTVVDKEGLFATNEISVYLYDSQLNVLHNFAKGAYTFNTYGQENNNRFKIVYKTTADDIDFKSVSAIVTINNNTLRVNANMDIVEVLIFDRTGSLTLELDPQNLTKTLENIFCYAPGVYFVKVKLINGEIITSKLIKK